MHLIKVPPKFTVVQAVANSIDYSQCRALVLKAENHKDISEIHYISQDRLDGLALLAIENDVQNKLIDELIDKFSNAKARLAKFK